MALFISFEGGEGSGKSTQAERLNHALADLGIQTISIHEPGSTNLGFHIRDLLKGKPWGDDVISHRAELLLFAASRAELVSKVLAEQMKNPRLVIIADRYVDSTVAYQGYGRELPLDLVDAVNSLATNGLMPNITFLIDCPPSEGLRRVGSLQTGLFDIDAIRRPDDEGSRRFEEEPMRFHQRVRKGYMELAKREPQRWVVIDGTRSEDEVFDAIWRALTQMDKFDALVGQDTPPDRNMTLFGMDETSLSHTILSPVG